MQRSKRITNIVLQTVHATIAWYYDNIAEKQDTLCFFIKYE